MSNQRTSNTDNESQQVSIDFSKSIVACAAAYGENAEAMKQYLLEGEKKALQLNNRGPLEFDTHGQLTQNIVDAYSEYGFYIFENVISDIELSDMKTDLTQMKANFPVMPDQKINAQGEPAIAINSTGPRLIWSKPLGDPLGGTEIANGRHQIKLFEPKAAEDAPLASGFIVLGSLEFSEACLRAYGHPDLLRAAATICGEDFAPFHESLFIKDAGLGAAVSWHQDGDTHWDSEEFEENIHGFNFMAQVYGSTPVNGVWVVPGTHKLGKLDIKAMVEASGSERLKDAVPIVCNPGDVVMCNRQIVHGSFANTGFEDRVTVNFGFHKRSSVLNITGAGIHCAAQVFDESHILERSKLIGYGIDARAQRYPHETSYVYAPLANSGVDCKWHDDIKSSIKDYNLRDLSI
jgi:hypothetical protein